MLLSVVGEGILCAPGEAVKVNQYLADGPSLISNGTNYLVVVRINGYYVSGRGVVTCRGLGVLGIGNGYKACVLGRNNESNAVLLSVIGEGILGAPGEAVKVNLCLGDGPEKVSNLSDNLISGKRGNGNLSCIIANCGELVIGIDYLNACGNILKLNLVRLSVIYERVGVIPDKSRNVNRYETGIIDMPNEVNNLAYNLVVRVNGSEGCLSCVAANIGSGIAAVQGGNVFGRIGAVLKKNGEGGAAVDKGSGVIPLCSADVYLHRLDNPRALSANYSGIELVVIGIKSGKKIYRDNLSNVIVACVGKYVIRIHELNVCDTRCGNGVGTAAIGERSGVIPHKIGRRNNSLIYLDNNITGTELHGVNSVGNRSDAHVGAAVGYVNHIEGRSSNAVKLNAVLVPLVGIGRGGIAGSNLYGEGLRVVRLFNACARDKSEFTLENRGKLQVSVGHLGDGVAILVNPGNYLLAIVLGGIGEKLDILVRESCGEEALCYKLGANVVLYPLDLLKADVDVNRSGNGININEGRNERSVLSGESGEQVLNIKGVLALVSEVALAVIQVHQRLVADAFGNKINEAGDNALSLVEVALILLNLVDYLLISEMSEVNVLGDILTGEYALKVNSLKKLNKLVKGEIIIEHLKLIYALGASLEDLELKLLGDKTGLAGLENRLVEGLGNSDVKNVGSVGLGSEINVVGNYARDIADALISAANDTRESEAVVTVLCGNINVVGKTHLVIFHLSDIAKSGKPLDKLLDGARLNRGVAVFAKRTEYV